MEPTVKTYPGRIGVAVSGGADSMALLHAFCRAGQDLVAVNVEHGIRGETSLRDTDFVRTYCRLNNIPFLTKSVYAPENTQKGESVETCARRLRYEYFEELLQKGVVSKIALAHHADDNAETVLMRLFRGTGIHGLIGITDRDDYIRPFVSYTKKQIREYVELHRIPFVNDETNDSSDYTRNYIRNELVPVIKQRYPDYAAAIARLSECAAEADVYLLSVCPKAEEIDGKFYIKSLFGFPNILQKYAIMQTVKQMGFLQDFETRHVESVLELRDKPTNTAIVLPFSLTCVRYGDGVIFFRIQTETFPPVPFSLSDVYRFRGKTYAFIPGEKMQPGVSFDPDKLPEDCVVRQRADGDLFKRVNGKTKLLSDFLNDKKLTKLEKDELLVLAKDRDVLAVLGLETSDRIKITPDTKRIMYITKE